jgi:formate-dependent nitrite reductase membrane component NrfD
VVVIGGLFVPLAIGIREVYYLPEETVWDIMTIPILGIISSVFGLAGGLLLRYVILASGVRAPLRAGKFEYPLPVQRL